MKAGYDAHYLAAIDLVVDRIKRGDREVVEVVPESWRYVSTAGVAPDPKIQPVVARYEAKLDEQLAVPVGTATVTLDTRRSIVRTAESNFGDLIADAMRAGVGADLALMNGGGIRGDRTYAPGTVLTRKDIIRELPFGNVVVLIELSGERPARGAGERRVPDRGRRRTISPGLRHDLHLRPGEAARQPDRRGSGRRPAAREGAHVQGGDQRIRLWRRRRLRGAVPRQASDRRLRRQPSDHHRDRLHIARQGQIAPRLEGRITRVG